MVGWGQSEADTASCLMVAAGAAVCRVPAGCQELGSQRPSWQTDRQLSENPPFLPDHQGRGLAHVGNRVLGGPGGDSPTPSLHGGHPEPVRPWGVCCSCLTGLSFQESSSGGSGGSSSSLLTNARSWGVRILHVDGTVSAQGFRRGDLVTG